MKNSIRFALAVLVLVVTAALYSSAQQSDTVSLVVERGDTLLSLFGPDWQKAYQQNRITVIRHGDPVESPDILVEGMVLKVSADTLLTARAAARVDGMNQRRAELTRRLETLTANATTEPDRAATIALCRSKLEAQQFYAADIDFVSGQVSELESALQIKAPASRYGRQWMVVILLLVAVLAGSTGAAWLRLTKRMDSTGLARYQRAEAQLNRLLERNAAGQKPAC